MDEYIFKDEIIYDNLHSCWIYFEQNNKLFKGKAKRIFEYGTMKYKLTYKQEVKYGLLLQNPKIKRVISDYGLPLIHQRRIKEFKDE